MRRTDQHNISKASRNQLYAAQDERSHDDLAELAVGLHERQQLIALELDQFAGFANAYLNNGGSARQHAGLAGKLPGTEVGNELLAHLRRSDDMEASCCDNEEAIVWRPRLDEDFAVLNGANVAVCGRALHLFGLQCREHSFC